MVPRSGLVRLLGIKRTKTHKGGSEALEGTLVACSRNSQNFFQKKFVLANREGGCV